ncbi:MAG: hypothetical protein HC834_06935 [Rhodospirillales bacterium]|nr:hypothetical protein [Rhodospirillales bacterium]
MRGAMALLVVAGVVAGGFQVRRMWRSWEAQRRRLPAEERLARGDLDEGLRLIDAVVKQHPEDRTARWERAKVLEKRWFSGIAAAEYAALMVPAGAPWSQEAKARLEVVQPPRQARKQAWGDLFQRGRAMIWGGPIPLELVEPFPGYMRGFFYDAVRAATSRKRLDALEPLGRELDTRFGGRWSRTFLERHRAMALGERTELVQTYVDLTKNPQVLTGEALEVYLQALREANASDLLMGALVLTGKLNEHLDEYQRLAKATQDPWFLLIAEQERAEQERVHNQEADAINRLLLGIQQCGELHMEYRCRQLELALAVHYRLRRELPLAQKVADTVWQQAREAGDWRMEAAALWELQSIARANGDALYTRLYGEEAEHYDIQSCWIRQHAGLVHARAAMKELQLTAAQHEMQTLPRCGEPLPLVALGIEAHLERADRPVASIEDIRRDIAALRARRKRQSSRC